MTIRGVPPDPCQPALRYALCPVIENSHAPEREMFQENTIIGRLTRDTSILLCLSRPDFGIFWKTFPDVRVEVDGQFLG
jgi:hypothetical protein